MVHAAGAIGAVSRRARDRLAGRVAARRVRAAAYRPMLRRSRARAQSWACARRLRAAQGEAHLPASKGVHTFSFLKALDKGFQNHIGFAIIRASGEEK